MEPRTLSPEQTLRTGRILWAALLVGPIAFAALVLGLPLRSVAEGADATAVGLAAAGVVATAVPLGWLLRARIWAGGTHGGVVAPARWLQGSLVLWALCEGSALLGLVAVMLDRPSPERLAVPAAALLAQAVAFPRAEPRGLGAR